MYQACKSKQGMSIFRSGHMNFPKIVVQINLPKQMIYELTQAKWIIQIII